MAGLVNLLRELHRIHRQARDLREGLARLPLQFKAQRAKAEKHENALKQAQEALKRVKVAVKEKESAIKSKTEQIEKWERQRKEVTTKKEFDALQAEINHAKEACSGMEDEILQFMAEIEERTAAMPELEQSAKTSRDEVARFDSTTKDKQSSINGQLAQVQTLLEQTEAALPEEHRPAYNRLIEARGSDALAPCGGRTCLACATEITAQRRNELTMDRLVNCNSCGRLLYLPEEPAESA